MLKALELNGFKSFADKTRFEFPPGITAVVGPNGSGKSNIVDAIKWVLGEQSVKSLRGKEMADVIFNGSGSRHAVNTAEATLTFDNADGTLGVDTSEVHITRRVYRSGEGEYLINRQPCRLRDIRDLFAGTGAATEAYSVIEQGKVDVLLQSSPRERRAIFEEAAGISRFKTKKLEASRRLERVEQNLLRLSDIVEEVDSRLRTVKSQASKARRYKEYTDRLQELRTQVGLTDWRKLSERLETIEAELTALRDEAGRMAAEAETLEAKALEHETEIARVDEATREAEGLRAKNRERIAANESTIEHLRVRSRDLEEEIDRLRRHVTAMNSRAGDLESHVATTSAELAKAETEFTELSAQWKTDQRDLEQVVAQHDTLRQENETRRREHREQLRRDASLGNRIGSLQSLRDAAQQTIDGRQTECRRVEQLQSEQTARVEQLQAALESCQSAAEAARQALEDGQTRLAATRREHAAAEKELAQLQGRHTAAVGRAAVLSELESRQEGLSAGVKSLLVRAREASEGPLRKIRGLVADLLRVSVDTAPLVEASLGVLAQHIVVAGDESVLAALGEESSRLEGRVGFLRLDYQPPVAASERIDLSTQQGVVGRADRFVETEPEFVPLVRRLLGQTWIVESLRDAMRLAAGAGRGLNFVTLSGDLLSASGTLVIGPPNAATGLISRRSELRALRTTIAELERETEVTEKRCGELETQAASHDQQVQQLTAAQQQASTQLSEQRSAITAARQRLVEIDEQIRGYTEEIDRAEGQRQSAESELTQIQKEKDTLEDAIAELELQLADSEAQVAELEQRRDELLGAATRQRVSLATSEQRLEGLRRQLQQLQHDQQERTRAVADSQTQLEQATTRRAEAEETMLAASSEVAELYLEKESLDATIQSYRQQRDDLRNQRDENRTAAQGLRGSGRKLDEQIHVQQLAAGQVQHERSTLAGRLREDYAIELAELEHEPTDEELHQREAVEEEIEDLRRKINNIGNVNLEALEELEQLESRFESLSAQYDDLTGAKASLEQIIGRINADSRRLFVETLEVVREHFQTLFRKLFGGGQADIILDEGEDVLESGIEIVARPPGKEPRSISLLSGGEKTLTCVALLMAIFKSRPSPFCVLDEVDAALDEANIERFVNVLGEFLTWTQFIIVTHSKKTMTCAGTLYGVTMQESGISKRVSVRFDDVSEDGHIHQRAIARSEAEEESSDDDQDETQAA